MRSNRGLFYTFAATLALACIAAVAFTANAPPDPTGMLSAQQHSHATSYDRETTAGATAATQGVSNALAWGIGLTKPFLDLGSALATVILLAALYGAATLIFNAGREPSHAQRRGSLLGVGNTAPHPA